MAVYKYEFRSLDSQLNWNDIASVFDGVAHTYGYRLAMKNSADDSANYIKTQVLGVDVPEFSSITKVEIGMRGYAGTSGYVKFLLKPTINGNVGSLYTYADTLPASDDNTIKAVDITADAQAPVTWTDNDLETVLINTFYLFNPHTSNIITYVDSLWLQVTGTLFPIIKGVGSISGVGSVTL